MKKAIYLCVFTLFIGTALIFINRDVATQQCINYQCQTLKMPLYLKALDFIDRHYHYKHLLKDIIKDTDTEEEKVMKIFEWTYRNIKRLPPDIPVIDDHIWYTIVRGYAADDQFCDIFSTLCNYAGIKAFFRKVYPKDGRKIIALSYVKNKDSWSVFDPYNGAYFQDKQGRFCRAEAVGSNRCRVVGVKGNPEPDIGYTAYYEDIPVKENVGLSRANVQSPLNRLLFELKKLKK